MTTLKHHRMTTLK